MSLITFKQDSKGPYIEKDPAAVKDYSLDWVDWLAAAASDTISTSSWAVDPGLTLGSTTRVGTVTTAYLSGGQVGNEYYAHNTIVTVGGRTEVRSFRLVIKKQ